jgi:hypothetical protein
MVGPTYDIDACRYSGTSKRKDLNYFQVSIRSLEIKIIWISKIKRFRTSKLVKSGARNLSFSNSVVHGSLGIIDSAALTRAPKALVRSRLTVAAKPIITHQPSTDTGDITSNMMRVALECSLSAHVI